MNRKNRMLKTILSACIGAMILLAGPGFVSSVSAAEEEKKPMKTRRVPSMSESVYKKLAEAQEAIELGILGEATRSVQARCTVVTALSSASDHE